MCVRMRADVSGAPPTAPLSNTTVSMLLVALVLHKNSYLCVVGHGNTCIQMDDKFVFSVLPTCNVGVD